MSGVLLALRQVRFESRAFWRNPAAAFFTFVLPLFFLVLFNSIFANDTIATEGGRVDIKVFFVPAIIGLGVISACYTNLGMTVTIARDLGVLKRIRGTPLPPWAYMTGRILQAMTVAALLVVVIAAAGDVAYGVDIPTNTMPAFIVTVMIGAAAFCALGLAITSFIPNADAAPAVVQASILPLLFVSDVFIHLDDPPTWLNIVGNVFPVKPFALALEHAYNPHIQGAGFEWGHLAVVAAWGVVGALVALRYFSWEPRR
ncbi:MAG: ABC transporter permease [Chloroflexota bacterium]